MKNKKITILSSVLGLLGLGVAGYMGYQKKQEHQNKQMLKEVRTFFDDFGSIKVLYLNPVVPKSKNWTGGVIFDDGVHFTFDYQDGEINYKEYSDAKTSK